MQILVTTPAIVKCNECGYEQIIDSDFFDDDPSSYDHGDNAMGEEIDHLFIAEVDCDICRNSLRVEARCSEYPVGAFNYDTEYEASGCEILIKPSVDPDYRDEIDDMVFYEPDEDVLNIVYYDLEQYQQNPELLRTISPTEFETAISEILQRDGFETRVTKKTRDGGKDIIAKYTAGRIPFIIWVECKQWNENNPVGIDVVEKLSAVQRDKNINKGVVVTTSYFTKDARDYADEHQMSLYDWDDLKDWLEDAKKS